MGATVLSTRAHVVFTPRGYRADEEAQLASARGGQWDTVHIYEQLLHDDSQHQWNW